MAARFREWRILVIRIAESQERKSMLGIVMHDIGRYSGEKILGGGLAIARARGLLAGLRT